MLLVVFILMSPLLFVLGLGLLGKIFLFFFERPGDEARYQALLKKLDPNKLVPGSEEYNRRFMPKI